MAEEVEKVEVSRLASELEAALTALDSALAEASRSVATIRGNISQLGYLADMVREMEAAMALARQNLSIRLASPPQTASPTPRPAPSDGPDLRRDEPAAAITEQKPETSEAPAPPTETEVTVEQTAAPAPGPETEATEPVAAPFASETNNLEPGPPTPERDTIRPISHRLRISVGSKTGSLDLKAVDGALNENPAVVDVALLDYDGRHATLKLWISGAADPQGVQEKLLASLRRRLGDEQDVEVRVDFEEAAAA